jgi:hypothetical protein
VMVEQHVETRGEKSEKFLLFLCPLSLFLLFPNVKDLFPLCFPSSEEEEKLGSKRYSFIFFSFLTFKDTFLLFLYVFYLVMVKQQEEK